MHTNIVDPLSAWLFPKVRMAVLARLLLDNREWHARDMARVTSLNHAAIGKELHAMADAGIAVKRRSGNRLYFAANPECPIHHELLMLVTKTAGLADLIRQALGPLSASIRLAYIYGSMASGNARGRSDVDLMVVGDASLMDVIEALEGVEKAVRREINALTFTAEEYIRDMADGEGFVFAVHKGSRIQLIGDANEFGQT